MVKSSKAISKTAKASSKSKVKCQFKYCGKPATILEQPCDFCAFTGYCNDCVSYYTKKGYENHFICASCLDGVGYCEFYFGHNNEPKCDCGSRLKECNENNFECGSANNALRKPLAQERLQKMVTEIEMNENREIFLYHIEHKSPTLEECRELKKCCFCLVPEGGSVELLSCDHYAFLETDSCLAQPHLCCNACSKEGVCLLCNFVSKNFGKCSNDGCQYTIDKVNDSRVLYDPVTGQQNSQYFKYGSVLCEQCSSDVKELPVGKPNCLDNLKIAVTGVFNVCSREDIEAIIVQCCGKVASSVSGKTDYLLIGKEHG